MVVQEPKGEARVPRPPIVVVMGHIDHGKSTILDYIRKTNVTAGEAGGITQHVSAYEIERETDTGKHKITFIDTPGHEAFNAMRRRGAGIADIAVLVVSAEDGVKAQTLETIKAIEERGMPYIVAINKVDRPNANPNKIRQELAEANVLVEGYGGHVPVVGTSAVTGQGIPELLDMILLVAEVNELVGNPDQPGEGYVLEADTSARTGITATVIVKNGTLCDGDYLVIAGRADKIRGLRTFSGDLASQIAFSAPAVISGFSTLPSVGEPFLTFTTKKATETHTIKESSSAKKRTPPLRATGEGGADTVIPLVLKADTAGSLEALLGEIDKLAEKSRTLGLELRVVSSGVGPVNESDVKFASVGHGSIILGFHLKADKSALELADKFAVSVQTFDIIYKLTDWLDTEITKHQPKVTTEESLGRARILRLFNNVRGKQIIGGVVLTGSLATGKAIRIIRRDSEIGRGKVFELESQRLKTKLVEKDKQFGAMVETKTTLAEGDTLEQFDLVEK